jgi:hypothetical protein
MPRPWLAAVLLALAPALGRADDPPLRNRPAHFSDAVGLFGVSTEAKPTELAPGQTLTLTVRVTATGPAREPPRRPNLKELPAFAEHFYVENLPGPDDRPDEASAAGKSAWEFAYRLKPRDATVDAVPSLPFVFYKPAPPGSTGHGSYQTAYAPRIPLTVKPAPGASATEGGKDEAPLQAPEAVYQIVEGPAVLRRPSSWGFAGPAAVVLVLLGAPALTAGWCLLWRRLYPDAARRARQRRSRAAQEALHALRALPRQGADEQPRQAAAIVATYLRERVDLPGVAPTADEAAAHLRQTGLSEKAADQVAGFFRACDVARFAPEPLREPGVDDWASAAGDLILALEAEPCLSQAS